MSGSPSPLLRAVVDASYGGKPALAGVELSIGAGEIVALIGQSGSGKSTMALAILGLAGMRGGKVAGSIEFDGVDLLKLSDRQLRSFRGRRIGLVFQSGTGALNPRMTVEAHIREAWKAHAPGSPDYEQLLSEVSLPPDAAFRRRYPRQLSVGQAQRVLIALGILHRPALLIADEPTSALDAITQSEILDLMARLNRSHSMAILLITHDLLSVARLAHRVAILRDGRLIEQGTVADIFAAPVHGYTRTLIGALPRFPESLGAQLGNLDIHLQNRAGVVDETTRVSVFPEATRG